MSRISIFGLGYVGIVTAGCLARDGHEIIGVDSNAAKVDMVNAGRSPIVERDTPDLIREAVGQGLLRATVDPFRAVADSDISLICVGTPSQSNGNLDLTHVRRVSEQIGSAIRNKADFHVVVCRSTVLPGSIRHVILPTLEDYSGRQAGVGFGLCNNPEFLREGTAVQDFYHPPKIVIGETDPRSGNLVASLYDGIQASMIRTDLETAEMVKYADNLWHALKVSFANEIGRFCKAVGVDGHRVMDLFCQDTKLNISKAYLAPGFAFGGSCLPKDVRAFAYKARTLDLELPVINAILPSNVRQVEQAFRWISGLGRRRVGILGLSFKPGTDDLRESPVVELVERLLGKGYEIVIFDPNVGLASLMGANRDYILNRIPHIAPLLTQDSQKVLTRSEIIVIGNGSPEFADIVRQATEDQIIVDLVRLSLRMTHKGKWEDVCSQV